MSSQNVSTNLSALSESIRATFQLIARLSKLSFQPASTPFSEDADARLELAQDIHDGLKQHEDTLDALRQEAEDFINPAPSSHRRRDSTKERERVRIAAQIARLQEDLKLARSQFRRAQLTAKRSSEAAKLRERELLFESLQQEPQSRADPASSTSDLFAGRRQNTAKQLTQDDILVNASSDVTSALRRTHDLLTSELSRSRFAQETLEQSTAALADLGERYTDLDSLLASSKNLLGTLVSSQKSDTWYLETAFWILVATLSWLVFRRLIYGPAWWFIWLPLKFFILKPFIFAFAALGLTGKPATTSISAATTSVTRAPLRIQPSASGGIPRFRANEDGRPAVAVPVGGGGRGAKVGPYQHAPDPSPPGSMSQKIGQMAEASREQASGREAEEVEAQEAGAPEHVEGQEKATAPEVTRRGDGTVLQDRGDVPRNPKKKMWEEDVESAKHQSRKRDEL